MTLSRLDIMSHYPVINPSPPPVKPQSVHFAPPKSGDRGRATA